MITNTMLQPLGPLTLLVESKTEGRSAKPGNLGLQKGASHEKTFNNFNPDRQPYGLWVRGHAEAAVMSIDRVLKIPQPKCLIGEFGDSTVNLELRVWINDPKNGFGSVKDAVLLAVWDSFHANDIEIAFPQRDLQIKSLRTVKCNQR